MRPTAVLFRRLRKHRLTTKTVGTNYYKGNRTGRMGDHTKYGGYQINYDLVRSYIVPAGLKEFKLTPFVTRKLMRQPMEPAYTTTEASKKQAPGQRYLSFWKQDNGDD